MKQYTAEITDEALADMDQLYDHIAHVFTYSGEYAGAV